MARLDRLYDNPRSRLRTGQHEAKKGDVEQDDDAQWEDVGAHGAEGADKVDPEDYRASGQESLERDPAKRSFKTDKEGRFWRRRGKAVPTS